MVFWPCQIEALTIIVFSFGMIHFGTATGDTGMDLIQPIDNIKLQSSCHNIGITTNPGSSRNERPLTASQAPMLDSHAQNSITASDVVMEGENIALDEIHESGMPPRNRNLAVRGPEASQKSEETSNWMRKEFEDMMTNNKTLEKSLRKSLRSDTRPLFQVKVSKLSTIYQVLEKKLPKDPNAQKIDLGDQSAAILEWFKILRESVNKYPRNNSQIPQNPAWKGDWDEDTIKLLVQKSAVETLDFLYRTKVVDSAFVRGLFFQHNFLDISAKAMIMDFKIRIDNVDYYHHSILPIIEVLSNHWSLSHFNCFLSVAEPTEYMALVHATLEGFCWSEVQRMDIRVDSTHMKAIVNFFNVKPEFLAISKKTKAGKSYLSAWKWQRIQDEADFESLKDSLAKLVSMFQLQENFAPTISQSEKYFALTMAYLILVYVEKRYGSAMLKQIPTLYNDQARFNYQLEFFHTTVLLRQAIENMKDYACFHKNSQDGKWRYKKLSNNKIDKHFKRIFQLLESHKALTQIVNADYFLQSWAGNSIVGMYFPTVFQSWEEELSSIITVFQKFAPRIKKFRVNAPLTDSTRMIETHTNWLVNKKSRNY